MSKTILITSIGLGDYSETEYYLEKEEATKHKTKFTSVALKKLIDDLKTAEVYLFSTKEAINKYKSKLNEEINVDCHEVELPDTEKKFWDLFQEISSKIPKDTELYLDITNAFRSLPFVFFGIIQYLVALKKVRIKGIFYGVYEKGQKKTPILDLIAMKEMIDWFYATEIFNNYGVSHLISENFRKLQRQIYLKTKKDGGFKKYGELFDNVSDAILNVDAPQLAQATSELLEEKSTIEGKLQKHLPIAKDLIDKIFNLYEDFTCPKHQSDEGKLELNENELNREKKIIDWYLKHNQFKNALTLINEWIINKAIIIKGIQKDWMDYTKTRDPISRGLKSICRKNVADDDIMSNINKLSDWRNELSHGGYRENNRKYKGMKDKINEAWKKVQAVSEDRLRHILNVSSKSTTWFVTRHQGAKEWAKEKGIRIDKLVDHFDPSQINRGDCMIGTLPVHLVADLCEQGAQYLHLSIDLPEHLRGKELTKKDMFDCNARLEEYKIERVN